MGDRNRNFWSWFLYSYSTFCAKGSQNTLQRNNTQRIKSPTTEMQLPLKWDSSFWTMHSINAPCCRAGCEEAYHHYPKESGGRLWKCTRWNLDRSPGLAPAPLPRGPQTLERSGSLFGTTFHKTALGLLTALQQHLATQTPMEGTHF